MKANFYCENYNCKWRIVAVADDLKTFEKLVANSVTQLKEHRKNEHKQRI